MTCYRHRTDIDEPVGGHSHPAQTFNTSAKCEMRKSSRRRPRIHGVEAAHPTRRMPPISRVYSRYQSGSFARTSFVANCQHKARRLNRTLRLEAARHERTEPGQAISQSCQLSTRSTGEDHRPAPAKNTDEPARLGKTRASITVECPGCPLAIHSAGGEAGRCRQTLLKKTRVGVFALADKSAATRHLKPFVAIFQG